MNATMRDFYFAAMDDAAPETIEEATNFLRCDPDPYMPAWWSGSRHYRCDPVYCVDAAFEVMTEDRY